MHRSIFLLMVLCVLPSVSPAADTQPPVIEVNDATLIAFFSPVTQQRLEGDVSVYGALSDFQWHLYKAKPELEEAGIKVHELYVKSFKVKSKTSITTFQPPDTEVGYYFIAPGKGSKIHYGVMDYDDLMYLAGEYFKQKN